LIVLIKIHARDVFGADVFSADPLR
jgi:hypothetical protein